MQESVPLPSAHGGVSAICLVLNPLAFPLQRGSDSHARVCPCTL